MQRRKGRIVWFTGLSGSGKSTICQSLAERLKDCDLDTHVLDGDEIRQHLCADLGFSIDDRFTNVRRTLHLAEILAKNGIIVLVALITPLNAMRALIRSTSPEILEVFVDAPLEVCEKRDPKGLYRMARLGSLKQLTGIDSPFERPTNPDLICHTDRDSVGECTEKIFARIVDLGPTNKNTRARSPSIAVDFDGVIADYSGWAGRRSLGNPRPDVISALHSLKADGWKIVVHTTRCPSDIIDYLRRSNVPYDEINNNSDYGNLGTKPVATVYWDDRSLRYSGDATKDLDLIRGFRTWNNRS